MKDWIQDVLAANLALPKYGMVTFTWGNVSAIDRKRGLVAIKPSGMPYENMLPEHMVVVGLDGKVVQGTCRPSSDTATHLEIYREFPSVGGVVHTHSRWATTFAQAGQGVRAYGTTQADYFYGEIPCTRDMTAEEIQGAYEYNTGVVIAERFKELEADHVPAVLVKNHGPFCWGTDPFNAVHNAVVLEEVAMMAFHTQMLTGDRDPMPQVLLDKHFLRKHGPNAYYGQAKK